MNIHLFNKYSNFCYCYTTNDYISLLQLDYKNP